MKIKCDIREYYISYFDIFTHLKTFMIFQDIELAKKLISVQQLKFHIVVAPKMQ
jgi:hypothetical protein